MRTALALIATAFMLVVLPLAAQATSTCPDCPDLVDQGTDVSAAVSVTPVSAVSSPREGRQDLIDRREMLVMSALSGSSYGGDNGGPVDMGGDGGSMGGGGGGIVPEPATGLMTALGLLGIAIGRRRRA